MITIAIVIIIFIGLYIINNFNLGYLDFIDHLIGIILNIPIAIIVGILIAISLPMDTIKEVKTSFQIESLQDGSEMNGRFFLGSGSFEGKMKYTFYYKEGDYFILKQIDHNKAKIKYSDESPHVVVMEDKPTEKFINWFALDLLEETYIINIPKGTIKNDYNLDAM